MADTRKQRRERAAKEARTIVPAATVERALQEALNQAHAFEMRNSILHTDLAVAQNEVWSLEAAYDRAKDHIQAMQDRARAHIIWAFVGGAVVGALAQLAA